MLNNIKINEILKSDQKLYTQVIKHKNIELQNAINKFDFDNNNNNYESVTKVASTIAKYEHQLEYITNMIKIINKN